jgi:TIR domain
VNQVPLVPGVGAKRGLDKENRVRAIFLSYRRDDAEGEAGRLFGDLTREFGTDKVFMDVAGIEPGRDFRKVIDQNVASCGVLLAMMGKGWIDAKDDEGRRRLDDPLDFVRFETVSALKRDIPVIPVLVHGGRLPRPEQLPEDLKDLAYRNAVELTHARWESDVQLLIKALRPRVGSDQEGAGVVRAKQALDRPPGKSAASERPGVGGTSSVIPPRPEKKSWRRLVVAAVAAIVIAVGVIGTYEYRRAQDAKVRRAAADAAAKQAAEDRRTAAEKDVVDQAAASKAAAEKEAAEHAAAGKASLRVNESKPHVKVSGTAEASSRSIANFAGTWELIENTYNGESRPVANPPLLTITQNGSLVRIGNRELPITSQGSVTYKTFYAQDNQHGHSVGTEAEASLADTLTWRLEGSFLVFETTFDYKTRYFQHPPGTDLRIMKYRRVSE